MENEQQQMNIDLKSAEDVLCEKCENTSFVPSFLIKKLSALVSPTGHEMLVPIQLFRCSSCEHVNESFLE
jgi:hypothetical protein